MRTRLNGGMYHSRFFLPFDLAQLIKEKPKPFQPLPWFIHGRREGCTAVCHTKTFLLWSELIKVESRLKRYPSFIDIANLHLRPKTMEAIDYWVSSIAAAAKGTPASPLPLLPLMVTSTFLGSAATGLPLITTSTFLGDPTVSGSSFPVAASGLPHAASTSTGRVKMELFARLACWRFCRRQGGKARTHGVGLVAGDVGWVGGVNGRWQEKMPKNCARLWTGADKRPGHDTTHDNNRMQHVWHAALGAWEVSNHS